MIDRKKLVTRHNVRLNHADALSPLSVGNGRFVFTADVTGLQTLNTFYSSGPTLNTMAEWGWNSHANFGNAKFEDALMDVDTYGRFVSYPLHAKSEQGEWLRANPHQSTLAQIGFVATDLLGHDIELEDVAHVLQELDLWAGKVTSQFTLSGKRVTVETVCHPEHDVIGVRVCSPLIADGKLGIQFRYPHTSALWGRNPGTFENDGLHKTFVTQNGHREIYVERHLENLVYGSKILANGNVRLENKGQHCFEMYAINAGSDGLTFTVAFAKDKPQAFSFDDVVSASAHCWDKFWTSGGAVDLSESSDSRWKELERRIVLSQYVTAIQGSGSLPPAETGLTCSSWFGKFHLEMHWWHAVHFALWGRVDLLENSMGYYAKILPKAKETAQRQGYLGARWPKMVGPDGQDSPSPVGPMLIWQQPHPIYYAELIYRQLRNREVLERYREVVFETAEFMASFAHWNDEKQHYDLGPPLIPAQENHKFAVTKNPVYELEYWHWALGVAQQWRERLGLERNVSWDQVRNHLTPMPQKEGLYLGTENRQDYWEDEDLWRDHPSFLCALGVLPGKLVDAEVMKATFEKTCDVWNWARAWGWDFPVAAMCAARLGLGEKAIDFLLLDVTKNTYLPNGHNFQAERLPLYLPGNGGLLTTIAMMVAGWDGCDRRACPGFPDNGQWQVQWEGLLPMP